MSQEKLTLEHLLAYAEHSVFVDIITAQGTKSPLILNQYTIGSTWNSLIAGMDVKLKLRPLSDFAIDPETVHNLPYNYVKSLLKNHADIFGLIPKGLAISIHDVG